MAYLMEDATPSLLPANRADTHVFFFGPISAIVTGFRVATVVRTKTKTQA